MLVDRRRRSMGVKLAFTGGVGRAYYRRLETYRGNMHLPSFHQQHEGKQVRPKGHWVA